MIKLLKSNPAQELSEVGLYLSGADEGSAGRFLDDSSTLSSHGLNKAVRHEYSAIQHHIQTLLSLTPMLPTSHCWSSRNEFEVTL
jgi:hypothetical protein